MTVQASRKAGRRRRGSRTASRLSFCGRRGGVAGAARGGFGESLFDDGTDGEGEDVIGCLRWDAAERTGGAAWMRRFREDPGFMTNLHDHPRCDIVPVGPVAK
jgi:hypothetical protein